MRSLPLLTTLCALCAGIGFSSVPARAQNVEEPCPEAVETRMGEFDHSARDKCIDEKKARIRDEKAALYAEEYEIEKIDVRLNTKWVRTSPDTFRAWFYCKGWIEEAMIPYQCERKQGKSSIPTATRSTPLPPKANSKPLEPQTEKRPSLQAMALHPRDRVIIPMRKNLHLSRKPLVIPARFAKPRPPRVIAKEHWARSQDTIRIFASPECGKNASRDEVEKMIGLLREQALAIPPQTLNVIASGILDRPLVQCGLDYDSVRFHNGIAARFRALEEPLLDVIRRRETLPLRKDDGSVVDLKSSDQYNLRVELDSPVVFISQGSSSYPRETTASVRPNAVARTKYIQRVKQQRPFEKAFQHKRTPQESLTLYGQPNTVQLLLVNPEAPETTRGLASGQQVITSFTRIGNFIYYMTRGASHEGEGYLYIPSAAP